MSLRKGNTFPAAGVPTYHYNEQNRLLSTVKVDGDTTETSTYTYDNNGNMLSRMTEVVRPNEVAPTRRIEVLGVNARTNTAAVYEYSAFNQLIRVRTGGGIATYTYNGEGLRVRREVNGNVLHYLYDYGKIVLEVDGNGVEVARNVYGTNLISRTVDGEKYTYLYNGMADVVALIDASGNAAATYYYDAFGNIIEETGDVNNPIRYRGKIYDEETGLYYLINLIYVYQTTPYDISKIK